MVKKVKCIKLFFKWHKIGIFKYRRAFLQFFVLPLWIHLRMFELFPFSEQLLQRRPSIGCWIGNICSKSDDCPSNIIRLNIILIIFWSKLEIFGQNSIFLVKISDQHFDFWSKFAIFGHISSKFVKLRDFMLSILVRKSFFSSAQPIS